MGKPKTLSKKAKKLAKKKGNQNRVINNEMKKNITLCFNHRVNSQLV